MIARELIVLFVIVINSRDSVAVSCYSDTIKNDSLSLLEQKLFCNDTFNDYSTRPVQNASKIIEVDVLFQPSYLIVEEEKQILKVFGHLRMKWQDEFLIWKPSDYGNIKEIRSEYYQQWHPQLTSNRYYLSSGGWYEFLDENDRYDPKDVKITYNGTIQVDFVVTLFGPCSHDTNVWPSDVWSCQITIARRNNENDLVIVKFENETALDLSKVMVDGEWLVEDITDPAIDDIGNTEHLELNVSLRRHLPWFTKTFVTPCTIFLILTIIPFWMTNNIIYRLLIHFLTALLQITYLQHLYSFVIQDSERNASIFSRYLDAVYINFIGIFITMINAKFSTRAGDPPKCIVDFLSMLVYIPYIGSCFSFIMNDDVDKSATFDTDEDCLISNTSKRNQKWIILLNFMDKTAFFIVAFYILYKWIL